MENERMKIAHMEKGRIFSQWKMIEKARLENAQHGKCTSGKRQNLPPLENDGKHTEKVQHKENVHPEKDGIYSHWKMKEKAHPEKAQHGKCTTWKMKELEIYIPEKARIYSTG